MQWRLKTGRTHQIRVHAKHMHHPLLGDEAYSGAGGAAVNTIGQGKNMRYKLSRLYRCFTCGGGQPWALCRLILKALYSS